ncbi:MAG: zinc ribbon domain-containing protein [Myxococcales bacterium FL481]|nr:MAG: zinc ribbon domain-containing protein [Myxococcales bacterium FL481]
MANVYEMFWDCEWCEAKKLLGKTHRSCPECGAPQDPKRRYFPAENEKVAVVDHVYYGVDRICDHCHSPNSAKAKHCVGCGAPIGDGDREAALIEWRARRERQETTLRRRQNQGGIPGLAFFRTRRGKIVAAIGAVLLLGLLATLVILFWSRSATVEVSGHRWNRSISIERYASVSDGGWCPAPAGAYGVRRSRRKSGTTQIPVGEDCSTVNVDNGDGTYRQETRCRTRYRSEPVYDDWCDYTIDRWVHDHREVASGVGRSPEPYWPATSVSACAGLGCTREGTRRGEYVVQYVEVADEERKVIECGFEQPRWGSTGVGSRWEARFRVLTGEVLCDKIVPTTGRESDR